MANYINMLTNFLNQYDVLNIDNPNHDILPIYYGPNENLTIQDLMDEVMNCIDHVRMEKYILTTIDYILYMKRNPNDEYMNNYVNDLNNNVIIVNNMIFTDSDFQILQMIINILQQCTFNQMKEVYNLFSGMNNQMDINNVNNNINNMNQPMEPEYYINQN